ncbi:MAG: methyl-accepting chemotaxis protein, partial [bacterium]
MHPQVKQAKRKIDLWIAILTFGGIALLIAYIWVLIPTITGGLIIAALAWMVLPTAAMVTYHSEVLMKRRWKQASEFLEKGETGEVTAQQALKAMLDFPVLMPLFGFAAWVVGGFFAAMGALWATDGKLTLADFTVLWLGVIAASLIITIFQFYRWRQILDPVVGLIVHKAPQTLNGEANFIRVSMKRVLLITLILLVALSLYLAEIAGYRQAANTLQNWVGKNKSKQIQYSAEKMGGVNWENLTDTGYRQEVIAELLEDEKDPTRIFLVTRQEDEYFDLISQQPYEEEFPELVVEILRNKHRTKKSDFAYTFNNFGPQIDVSRRFRKGEGEDAKTYYMIFGYPWQTYRSQLDSFIWISGILMILVVLLSAGVVVQIAREISQPIARLVDFMEDITEGKIHQDVFYHANDELGDLSLSVRRMSGQLGSVIMRIQNATKSLDEATGSIRQALGSTTQGSRQQEEAVEDVSAAMTEMDQTIQGIAENVETLSASAEESSSSIFEMGAAIKKINENVDILNQSIGDVSSSINETTAALDQVAENVSNLSSLTEETASSMAEMDASIRQVEQNTNETAQWSESVIKDAEAGVEAVSQVTRGINDISEVVHSARQVIERLGGRVEEIGKIVKVIDDIANQTNLLALNAAIIAAQAGEHGRGFAVVADEIKQLADRTSGSTREIHQLIRGVQDESRQAVGAVEEGTRAVEEGVKLADQASNSLAQILESTHQATERVHGVARTTQEQAES